jgi:hypothetical protein
VQFNNLLGGIMTLEIVWRNPVPPVKTERRVEPITVDEFGALYAVRAIDRIVAFEVMLGGAA